MSWSKFSILLVQLTKSGTMVAIVIVIEKGIIFYPFTPCSALRSRLKNYSQRTFFSLRGGQGSGYKKSSLGAERGCCIKIIKSKGITKVLRVSLISRNYNEKLQLQRTEKSYNRIGIDNYNRTIRNYNRTIRSYMGIVVNNYKKL